ncbi:hypothetical protein FJT64_019882 [Amphibalanus amphitrite]|uniref:Uncharacterized protein n=1 Tax=Amphibalanus amphitrite TaxID=1232801 RepID=A0A6A4WQ87_AMPAM|nr:hypothetical protein FJT64_019882 [Amphibalanus amphitrite]
MEVSTEIHRELPTRRVGSGRIVSRDEGRCRPAAGGRWERLDVRLDKAEQRPERLDERRTDRERRGGFGRDWLAGSERPASSGFGREPGQGGSGRRRPERPERRSRADDQPEWFSAGPTSQNDMVELHGFGDEGGADPPTAAEPEHGPAECSAPTAQHKQEKVSSGPGGGGPFLDDPAIQSTIQHHGAPGAHLDLDAILRCDMDALPGPSAVGGAAASVGFSRWFRRQSPPAAAAAAPDQQPRSSLHHQLVGNIINDPALSARLTGHGKNVRLSFY